MATLDVTGMREQAVKQGLLLLRDELKRSQKKDEEKFGLHSDGKDLLEEAALDVLEQLGWRPTKKGSAEVIRDPRQLEAPLGAAARQARVKCLVCARSFAVPAGEALRACPDCGAVHRVKSDDEGTVFQRRQVIAPPDEILQLMIREQSQDLAPLSHDEVSQLAEWRSKNPDHVRNPEEVERGDRVADPAVPGSGNPLRIDCHSLVGNECQGFDATDTPGATVCPACGQKYSVLLGTRDADGAEFAYAKVYAPEDGTDFGDPEFADEGDDTDGPRLGDDEPDDDDEEAA